MEKLITKYLDSKIHSDKTFQLLLIIFGAIINIYLLFNLNFIQLADEIRMFILLIISLLTIFLVRKNSTSKSYVERKKNFNHSTSVLTVIYMLLLFMFLMQPFAANFASPKDAMVVVPEGGLLFFQNRILSIILPLIISSHLSHTIEYVVLLQNPIVTD